MNLLYSLSTIPINKFVRIVSITKLKLNLISCNICNYRSTRMSEILIASKAGNFLEVKCLVEAGVDVNCKDKDNTSVLHNAAESGSLEIVKYLVEHGADVNCKDKHNWSVLLNAAESGSLEIVKYLVEHGADVNFIPDYNTSVLHNAAESDSLEIVKYLVELGADVNCKNKGNLSVLHYAANSSSLEIVKYLIAHGCNVNIGDETIIDYLFRRGVMKDIHDCDHSGRSLLSIACYCGNIALVQALLKYKVDVRKEKELVCGNEEIANIIKLELKKSSKHRGKIEDLNVLGEKLKKVLHFCRRCIV